jgi:membrane fusion protein, multidrug efflux system
MRTSVFLLAGLACCLAGCFESEPAPTEPIRPVRALTVQTRAVSQSISLTGHIMPEEVINLAFRLDGKLTERSLTSGAIVRTGELVARLDPQIQQNTARAAEADLSAARASLTQAERTESREKENYNKGVLPKAQYDQIVQQLQSARAQVDAAQARLNSAQQQVGYTELRSEVDGIVIAKGAEPGEVVRAGQPIVQIARGGKKDAVFDVPPRLLNTQGLAQSPPIEIALADNPSVRMTGFIRQIGVQTDAMTRTVPVRVALPNATDEMRFGATVNGSIVIPATALMEIPSSALTESKGEPAVWVVSPRGQVSLRSVRVARYNPGSVIISEGLDNGEKIVTAGVQSLRPGQTVMLLDPAK